MIEIMPPRPDENTGLYFHELSKDKSMGGRIQIPADSQAWPKSWKEVEYKSYKNAATIKLASLDVEPETSKSLLTVLKNRKSSVTFTKRKISLPFLESIINYSVAAKSLKNRMYPSGGGRYSIELYFLVQHSDDIEVGLYHYNVREHSLEQMQALKAADIPIFSAYDFAQNASVALFMTSVFDRSTRKYGERGYRYILQESGHIGQNIYLACTSLELPVRALGGTDDVMVEKFLEIDGTIESLVYTIVFG